MFPAVLCASLVACGDDDDNGVPGGGGGSSQTIELDQLTGTWFGTFNDGTVTETFQFDVDGTDISNVILDGNPDPLTGTILERADEIGDGARVFRFEATVGPFNPNGILIVDPSATYMVYLYSNQQFGVLQKGATEMPAGGFQPDALAGDWDGITATAATVVDQDVPLSPVEQTSSSATCTTDSADDTSQCDITVGETAKTASALALQDPALGAWSGSYEGEADGSRVLLSPDANFAGVWGCTGLPDGFPENCDFSAWTKGGGS